jgi:hypothetical protein
MWNRLKRAWSHTHSVEFVHSVIPAIITAVFAAGGSWLATHHDDKFSMSTVTYPLIAGLLGFLAALMAIHGLEFLYRFFTGKASKGSPRTLVGLNLTPIRDSLRKSMPQRAIHFGFTTPLSVEVGQFLGQLETLLEQCGWELQVVGHFAPVPTRDLVIQLPPDGNDGLKMLGELLERSNYKVKYELEQAVGPDGLIMPSLLIGEATH